MEFWDLRVNGSCKPICVTPCCPQFSFQCKGDGLFWASVTSLSGDGDEQEVVVSTPENNGFFFPTPLAHEVQYRFSVSDGWEVKSICFETCIKPPATFFRMEKNTTLQQHFWVPFDYCWARLCTITDGNVSILVNQETLGKGYAADIEQGVSSKKCHTYLLDMLLWGGSENQISFSTGEEPTRVAAKIVLRCSDGKRQHLIVQP